MRFVFSKEEEEDEEEDEESVNIMFYLHFVPCEIISLIFCMQLLFDIFSTLMSLEVRLN